MNRSNPGPLRVPAHQLDRHRLLEVLAQRIDRLRPRGIPSSTGTYGGGVSKGNPSTVSLEAMTMRARARPSRQDEPSIGMPCARPYPAAGT